MSLLLSLQQIFPENIAKLILYAYMKGFKLTLGEGFNAEKVGHRKNSNHYIKLAQDLSLFQDNIYLRKTEDYEFLGKFWKRLNPLNRWGGDFLGQDGNHFSMEFEGRQ